MWLLVEKANDLKNMGDDRGVVLFYWWVLCSFRGDKIKLSKPDSFGVLKVKHKHHLTNKSSGPL